MLSKSKVKKGERSWCIGSRDLVPVDCCGYAQSGSEGLAGVTFRPKRN